MNKVTDEMLDSRPTLWGSSIHPLLAAVERGDRAAIEKATSSVEEVGREGGYYHSPGQDDQFVSDLLSLWEEVNGKW